MIRGFGGDTMDERLVWTSAPPRWALDGDVLTVEPTGGTDFWQGTHYGFRVDNGHLLAAPVPGDFELTVTVGGTPRHQYDQAGVMVRCSPATWVKASIEHEPSGPDRLGAVVTNHGWSDWSTQDTTLTELELRIVRTGDDVAVHARPVGAEWSQLRIAHLHEIDDELLVGVYACSPKGEGYVASFRDFRLDT
jgi:hypothetical protein